MVDWRRDLQRQLRQTAIGCAIALLLLLGVFFGLVFVEMLLV
jgi:hypothetical protein